MNAALARVRGAWRAAVDFLSTRIIRRSPFGRYNLSLTSVSDAVVRSALTTASTTGDLTYIADIHDLMPATDPHIYGVRRQLRAGVAGINLSVVPADDSPAAQKAADLVKIAEDRPGVNNSVLVNGIIEGGLRGASLTEVYWAEPSVGTRFWTGFGAVPEQRLRYDIISGELHLVADPRKLSRGEPLSKFPEGKFVRAQVDQDVPDFSMRGSYRAILPEWFGRINVSKWEQIAIERYGMPIPVGKYATPAAHDALIETMKEFGSAGMLLIDSGSTVEWGSTSISTGGQLVHETYLEKSAERISIALLGATQTVSIAANAGSKQSADTHQGIRRDILYSILELITESKRRDLWTPFIRMNLGDAYVPFVPICVPEFDEAVDLLTTANAWDVLINKVGLKIGSSYAYQLLGIEEPEPDDVLLTGAPPPPAAASPFGGLFGGGAPAPPALPAASDAGDGGGALVPFRPKPVSIGAEISDVQFIRDVLAEEWDPEEHPRGEGGKFATSPGGGEKRSGGGSGKPSKLSDRAARARASHKPSTQAKQRIAAQGEDHVSEAIGGEGTDDNDAFDVLRRAAGKLHAVEVKTLIDNKNDKITMHPSSRERKEAWAKRENATMHTVVVDKRGAKQRVFYHAGVGSFRLASLTPVRDAAHLRELIVGSKKK